jgi:hypothetical protein
MQQNNSNQTTLLPNAYESKQLTTLNWTSGEANRSLFARGKHDYYAILVRGLPEQLTKDIIAELYVTDKKMTIREIKFSAINEKIELLSRSIVLGNSFSVTTINRVIEEMKDTAERREKENPNNSISTNYNLR